MRTERLNGIPCRFRIDGAPEKPAILMCNSLGTDHTMWDAQADALSRRFHVIRFDTRGHGGSGAPDGPYSLEMLANDALAVADLRDEVRASHLSAIEVPGAFSREVLSFLRA